MGGGGGAGTSLFFGRLRCRQPLVRPELCRLSLALLTTGPVWKTLHPPPSPSAAGKLGAVEGNVSHPPSSPSPWRAQERQERSLKPPAARVLLGGGAALLLPLGGKFSLWG